MLRVQLSNEFVGTLVMDDADPKGLDKLSQTIKRSAENDGVIHEISLALDWPKKARSFIKTVYDNLGIEGVIIVNVFERNANARKWELFYTGVLDLTKYSITETLVTLPINQTGFQKKVLNLLDIDVDIETLESQGGEGLAATPSIDLEYHAKRILKTYNASPTDNNEFQQLDAMTMHFDHGGDDIYRDVVTYGQIDNSDSSKGNELTNVFTLPYGYQPIAVDKPAGHTVVQFLQNNKNPRNEIYRATEAGNLRRVDIKLTLKHEVDARNDGGDVDICGSGALGDVEFQAWIEHRRANNDIVSINSIGSMWNTPGCGGFNRVSAFETKTFTASNVPVLIGDKFYVYFTARVYGTYEEPATIGRDGSVAHTFKVTADKDNTFILFQNETEFAATQHKTIMIYEALSKMAQYYTDQQDALRSTFFGRTDTNPAYPGDGKGSLMGLTTGRILRNLGNEPAWNNIKSYFIGDRVTFGLNSYTAKTNNVNKQPDTEDTDWKDEGLTSKYKKTMFLNLEESVKNLNSLWCLGMGFETIDGSQKLVIEEKAHFYNKENLILELGCVSNLKKEVALNYYYSQVEIGYPKIDAGQVNGVDEANTLRRYIAPLTQAKSKLTLTSTYKSSGYEIESQRRLQNKTVDSRNDESVFMTMVRRSGLSFETDRNQDFDYVSNLYDPDTAYNLKIMPGRNIRRWIQVLGATLWANTTKVFKFGYGEGNYEVVSKITSEPAEVNEKGDVDVSPSVTIPIWYPEIYTFKHPMTSDQFKIVRANPYGFFKFKDNLDNVMEGYLLELSREPNINLADFKLLRVYR